jgi:predicted nucleic acid-binding protein
MEIFFDSCIAIYLVEERPEYAERIHARLAGSRAQIAYSPLVEMECLLLPMRQQRLELLERFRHFFALSHRLNLPDAVYEKATELRARHGLKTPDALHLATALHHRCDELWTNDARLSHVSGGLAINVLA